ncbi:MAG: acyl-ACP--UDP-N-acetylglucosamine O-acyltransferase [Proteobacteria bacterium]|nr:acyl-ACP--UDP-N-acetylglucosamine O-acyltransferase [Pseudomonadota bacterium]
MIDARAVIAQGAKLGPGVSVGPYAIIGAQVEIGAGTWIGPHVVITGRTRIGRDNKIFQFASIGEEPQDKKYAGEDTALEIGDRNVIREYCTISRGTAQGGGITQVGNDNWIMAYVHIAHDCKVGHQTIFANSASLAGHVTVEDYAILGGFTLVHQFCAIGAHCFCGMGSVISKDVPPYTLMSGNPVRAHGLNSEGLKRRGFSAETLRQLHEAYKVIYKSKLTLVQAITRLQEMQHECAEIGVLVAFLERATRGIVR